jgi:hypothetical protein
VSTGAAPATSSIASGVDLVRRVESSTLETRPFDHIYMEEVFPAEYYRRLLGHLPDVRRYRELRNRDAIQPDGRSARRKLYLFPEVIALLPAGQRRFWLDLSRQLRSRALQQAFKQKFRGALERRFGRSIDRLWFYPVPMLLRDLGGYRIGIHSDSISKAITVQLYLPRDDSQAHLGTVFHEGRSGEAAERTKRLGFRPATGYAFPVLRRESFHSVPRMSDGDGERNSLMLTYYTQEGLHGRLFERAKRYWLFLAYGFRR